MRALARCLLHTHALHVPCALCRERGRSGSGGGLGGAGGGGEAELQLQRRRLANKRRALYEQLEEVRCFFLGPRFLVSTWEAAC